MKEYHSELTDIIRLYLENQLGIAAIEMTTDDILDAFGENQTKPELLQRLRQILTIADMAKFAKAQPLPAENELSLENAFRFVKETMPEVQINGQANQLTENQINKG
jgi:hypothetical protein